MLQPFTFLQVINNINNFIVYNQVRYQMRITQSLYSCFSQLAMVTRTDIRCLQVTPIVTNLNIVNINVNVVNLALINLVKVNGGTRININQVSTSCHALSVFAAYHQQPYCL